MNDTGAGDDDYDDLDDDDHYHDLYLDDDFVGDCDYDEVNNVTCQKTNLLACLQSNSLKKRPFSTSIIVCWEQGKKGQN